MNDNSILSQNVSALIDLLSDLPDDAGGFLELASLEIVNCLQTGGAIFWCGNGGSAAESQHMAAELMGRFLINRKPYRSISLTTDTSAITGIANDFGYSEIFKRQLEGIAKPGDFLVCYSTSGKSENINLVLKVAREMGVQTLAFLGSDGGEAIKIAKRNYLVKSNITARVQEIHTLLGHTLCQLIESKLEAKTA